MTGLQHDRNSDPMAPREKPIRILRIITRLNIGGPAIQAVSLTGRFSKNGFESRLMTGSVGAGEGDMAYLAGEAGVSPVYVPELGRELSPRRDLKAFWRIYTAVRRFKPHVVHTHTAKAGALGRLAALAAGGRPATVHTFHGNVFDGYFGRTKSKLFVLVERLLARFTDRIVVISESQRREICETYRIAGSGRVKTVPLGFDLSDFAQAPGRRKASIRRQLLPEGAGKEAFLFGCIGRLTAVKNHRLLLAALERIQASGRQPSPAVVLVGDGELKASLFRAAAKRGVEDRVRFAGWHRDMPPVYGALDAVVLTSRNEGTPVTLIEAMAAGRPVAATDVGGVSDLLGRRGKPAAKGFFWAERGLLVPPDDPDALAGAMDHLRQGGPEVDAMSRRAQAWVLRHYGADRLVEDLRTLYLELIRR